MTETDTRQGRSAADLDAVAGGQPVQPAAVVEPTTAAVEPAAAVEPTTPAGPATEASVDDVLEALKDVVDPELGINIVDLGLIYDVVIDSAGAATLDMTLTSAACPLTDMIEDQVSAALLGTGDIPALVNDFRINWVWMPPWDLTKITDDGRDQLRALGFSI